MYFGFRITVCADGTEVIDRRQGTFCCWLTPLQMAEYLEMDKQLAVMDRMERKGRRGIGMGNQIQTYLGYANGAAEKIREINRIFGGSGWPEEGSLLGDVFFGIAGMVQIYLSPITGKEVDSDELNDITTEIMFAEKEGIADIARKYCGLSV